ncbi:MAG: nucleotidyltransferase family protein [Flavobacteriales bacterium]|nr:nucleotidyltransferase family protein [Flavobacteriales bacterium]
MKTNINKIESFHVSKIALFGSFVRDEQHSNSDIDILVEFEKKFETFDNYMDLKFYLEDLFDRKVDLVIISSIKPTLI